MRRLQTRFVADMSQYTENFFLGMTPRQTICGISVVIFTVAGHLLLHIDTVLCVILGFPLLLLGFYRPEGLPMEKWVRAWIEAHLANTPVRFYNPDNIVYDFLWRGVIGGRKVFDPQKYLQEEDGKDTTQPGSHSVSRADSREDLQPADMHRSDEMTGKVPGTLTDLTGGRKKKAGKKNRRKGNTQTGLLPREPEQKEVNRLKIRRRERRRNEENIREAALFTAAFTERKEPAKTQKEEIKEECNAFTAAENIQAACDPDGWADFIGPVCTQEETTAAVHCTAVFSQEELPPCKNAEKVPDEKMEIPSEAQMPSLSLSSEAGPAAEEQTVSRNLQVQEKTATEEDVYLDSHDAGCPAFWQQAAEGTLEEEYRSDGTAWRENSGDAGESLPQMQSPDKERKDTTAQSAADVLGTAAPAEESSAAETVGSRKAPCGGRQTAVQHGRSGHKLSEAGRSRPWDSIRFGKAGDVKTSSIKLPVFVQPETDSGRWCGGEKM